MFVGELDNMRIATYKDSKVWLDIEQEQGKYG